MSGLFDSIFGGGGSNTQIVIPEGEAPRAFQTVIPQKSYKDLAESMNRTEKEYNRVLDQRYDMVGTGADIGAKQRGIEMQEAASYASSLPSASSPDTSFKATPRPFDITSKGNTFQTTEGQFLIATPAAATPAPATPPKSLAKEAAELRHKDAKEYYLAAVQKAKDTPRSYMPETVNPGFAQNKSDIYLPKALPKSEKTT
tara:strand:- start:888 stop:1487 length:600 start_codon:yes stop_codon:yes gene_type:complete